MRVLSLEGLRKLEDFESFSPVPYKDIAGWWTIGYGKKLSRVKPPISLRCTKEEAEQWMKQSLNAIESYLDVSYPNLSQHAFDALGSLLYNVGIGEFATSHFAKLLHDVPISRLRTYWLSFSHYKDESGVWKVSPGLESRRIQEFNYACLPDKQA